MERRSVTIVTVGSGESTAYQVFQGMGKRAKPVLIATKASEAARVAAMILEGTATVPDKTLLDPETGETD